MSVLTNLLKYKDYYARIAFDPSADAFYGRVIGIKDVIDFYGRSPDELREEFKHSVEDYLAWCAEEGTKPEKTWLGKLTIRVDEDLRRQLAVVAAASGESVNAWITTLLERETTRVLKEQGLAG
jgi:predicted HicB family RNase H-like nuclease